MANSLLRDFQDIGYREYINTGDVPFVLDKEAIDLESFADGTIMPIKPRVSVASYTDQLIVKRLWSPNGQNMDERSKRLILKEARCLQNASHQHVVGFNTAYYFESPLRPYMGIVMDRADEDIRGYLEGKKNRQETSVIPRWFRCLANVVRYVHGRGITHRDIKPPNILVKDGKVLLADFGISKMTLSRTLGTTDAGTPRARTPQYAAPEVEEGSTRGRSADIFSLGAVFLEMLVAHSFPQERCNLTDIKTSPGGQSYAKQLCHVQKWMQELHVTMHTDQRWQRMILQLCRDMMKADRDQRPTIEEVYEIILSEDPPMEPFGSRCVCIAVNEDLTNDKRLIEASKCGDQAKVDALLSQRVSPNTIGALHQASANGFDGIVRAFIRHRVNINLKDYSDQTALHCAAGCGQERVVETLLNNGAKAGLQDAEGRTPLHYASGHGNSAILSQLLAHGADVNVQDDNKQTALHLAAKGKQKSDTNHEEVIQMLLSSNADANAVDSKNWTPKDYASCNSHEGRVKLLGINPPTIMLLPNYTNSSSGG